MYRLLALALCSLLVSLAACGDGNLVDDFTACGGDVVGEWTIQNTDSKLTASPVDDCPTATGRFDQDATGTISIRSDMTYTVMIELTGTAQVTFPAECLTEETSCAGLNNPEEGLVCAGDVATSCTCALTIDDDVVETGTWTATGNDLTLTPENEDPDNLPFCVSGNELTVQVTDDDINLVQVFQATR